MSELNEETRVDVEELLGLVVTIFERCGMSQADAVLLTDSLVYADLCGTHSHGVLRVPEYVEKLTTQGVNPTAKPDSRRRRPLVRGRGRTQFNGTNRHSLSYARGDRQSSENRQRSGSHSRQQSLRCHGVFRPHGAAARHDRNRDHECASNDGTLGRCRANLGH